eukprot:5348079-Amphidinium_carterae.1
MLFDSDNLCEDQIKEGRHFMTKVLIERRMLQAPLDLQRKKNAKRGMTIQVEEHDSDQACIGDNAEIHPETPSEQTRKFHLPGQSAGSGSTLLRPPLDLGDAADVFPEARNSQPDQGMDCDVIVVEESAC